MPTPRSNSIATQPGGVIPARRNLKKMSYRIIRSYLNPNKPSRTIENGLTLEEAQAHCSDPETSSRTCTKPHRLRLTKKHGDWFDGYEEN